MKTIAIIATGGTIAGKGKSSSYKAGEFAVDEIVKSIPQIEDLAHLKMIPVCQVDSNDMNIQEWIKLRNICHEMEQDPEIDGMVITHGTDTLEETSFFLNLTLNVHKPVVLTGAMRPATATSADGPMNLYEAVALACDPSSYEIGVLAVVSDTIYSGRDLTKTNSIKTDAFEMAEFGNLGYMRDDQVYLMNKPYRKHTFETVFSKRKYSSLPKVGIMYVHSNVDPQLFTYMLEHYEGVVLAGTGSGNYPKEIQEIIASYTGDCKIVRSSRLLEGAVFESEAFDPERHTIPSYRLSPHKARILLMISLEMGCTQEQIAKYFSEY